MIGKETKQTLILSLLGLEKEKVTSGDIDSRFIGKKVMIRTYSAGVHFGVLQNKCGQQVILKDSRRVHSWVKSASLSQLSQEGSKDISGCRIAMVVPELLLDQVIEVLPMSEAAIASLYGASEWKNS